MAKIFGKKLDTRLLLVAILALAAFLRLWRLDQVPVGLFGDEVDIGYHAYSILQTGRDYMGQFLPTYIHSLAEWRAPLFLYSAVPTVAIFGLNEWGVRVPAAIFGIIGVYLIYLLGKSLKSERLGLISATLLAVLPWHIHYSRAGFEVTLLMDLVLGATLILINKTSQKWIAAAAILFALTPYTYSTSVVFTPLFVLFLLFVLRNTFARKRFAIFFVTLLIIAIPFIRMTFFGPGAGRFSLLSVFNDDITIDAINIERTLAPPATARLFHNKIVAWSEIVASNYVKSFSPEFLFVRGDPNPRHSVPGAGVLYWAMLPLFLIGLFELARQRKRERWILLGWLAIAPIPASLTVDAQHATRLFLMIPPLVVISALGWQTLSGIKRPISRLVSAGLVVLLVVNTVFYLHRYFNLYNIEHWRYWHYGYKDAMKKVGVEQHGYKTVFINNTYEPSLLHYLFWTKYSPEEFDKKFTGDIPQDGVYPGFNGFALGRLYFGETQNLLGLLEPGMLYVAAQGKEIPGDWDWGKDPPQGVKVLDVIRTPEGKPLFTIVSK